MNYWLVKSEPETFSWDDLVSLGTDMWNGVRNYQARNNLQAMKLGDKVLFYHSVIKPGVVGLATVSAEHYPDPTIPEDPRWVAVDITADQALPQKVTLAAIKANPKLAQMQLIKQSRLSVMAVTPDEYNEVLNMANQ
jgi:predicted RNA-binding protein with PUA-like domain